MRNRVVMSWSGGKDAALSLYKILNDNVLNCVGLLTTLTNEYDRVTLHGVRRQLIERQALVLEMPLDIVYISSNCSMEQYGAIMKKAVGKYRREGVRGFVFGDIFLEDVRKYREEMLGLEGFEAYFPLWGRDTRELVQEFVELKFKAIVTCVDGGVLDPSYVGRELDESFINDLPSTVDPAGENGEYHSFVYDGPIFNKPIPIRLGEIVERKVGGKKFYYCDLQLDE